MEAIYRCGHRARVSERASGAPTCPTCGARGIARMLNVPLPRITGHGSGPLVQAATLGEMTPVELARLQASLAPGGPLKLKRRPSSEERA